MIERIPASLDTDRDLVSVIIPSYNRARLVVQAIESVRRQTWKNVQIIVVDDGSTDETQDLIEPMADVLYLRQQNRGQASARNLGLRHARGSFICSLDSDDVWQPSFLQQCVEALRSLDADFVFANWATIEKDRQLINSYFEKMAWWQCPESELLKGWRIIGANEARSMFLEACLCPSSGVVFRRERVIHGWFEALQVTDDWCLILDAVLSAPCRVAFTMQRLWTKRNHGDNVCDHGDWIEFERMVYVVDALVSLRRVQRYMTRFELAKLHRRIAFCSLDVALLDWKMKRKTASAGAIFTFTSSLLKALYFEPEAVLRKLKRRVAVVPALPSSEDLEREGLSAPLTAELVLTR